MWRTGKNTWRVLVGIVRKKIDLEDRKKLDVERKILDVFPYKLVHRKLTSRTGRNTWRGKSTWCVLLGFVRRKKHLEDRADNWSQLLPVYGKKGVIVVVVINHIALIVVQERDVFNNKNAFRWYLHDGAGTKVPFGRCLLVLCTGIGWRCRLLGCYYRAVAGCWCSCCQFSCRALSVSFTEITRLVIVTSHCRAWDRGECLSIAWLWKDNRSGRSGLTDSSSWVVTC